MAEFACDRCGKCCVSLGPYVTIERQLNDRDYYCRCEIGNTLFLAHVDPAYREEISGEFADEDRPHHDGERRPCMFLRKSRGGAGTICAIYASRPQVCRNFRCYRMLVRDHGGDVCGKVIGKNTLRTEDTALEKIWNEQVTVIPYGDIDAWKQKVSGILAEHGYRADPVE